MPLKHAILVILENKPGTGYDIAKEFDNSISYVWNATHQQIYLELAKLNKMGHVEYEEVEQSSKPSKKVYSITHSGRKELTDWLDEPVPMARTRDPFMIKLAAGHLADPRELLKELLQLRENHLGKLEQLHKFDRYYHTYDKNFQDKFRLKYLSLKRGILEIESWLEWSAEVEQTLRRKITRNPPGKREGAA